MDSNRFGLNFLPVTASMMLGISLSRIMSLTVKESMLACIDSQPGLVLFPYEIFSPTVNLRPCAVPSLSPTSSLVEAT